MHDKPDRLVDSAAVIATSQNITADHAIAPGDGLGSIPPADEIIAEPNPSDYVCPRFLSKTSPELVTSFQELLGCLCELNARFSGERTVDVQAYLSLTGEHEQLEGAFFTWCRGYFDTRGNLDQLNPQLGNDPWKLFWKCMLEFHQLLDIYSAPQKLDRW